MLVRAGDNVLSLCRFCIFDHCQSYGTATFSRSCGSLSSSYFINCGRTAVTAMDAAKVSVFNCDFGQTELTETVVSCTGSDVTVSGCYLQGIQVGQVIPGQVYWSY